LREEYFVPPDPTCTGRQNLEGYILSDVAGGFSMHFECIAGMAGMKKPPEGGSLHLPEIRPNYCEAPMLVCAGLAVLATAFSFWKKYSLS
jgi:hypothetical protein